VRKADNTTTYFNVPNVMEIWEPKPPGTLWAIPGLLRDSFTVCVYIYIYVCVCVCVCVSIILFEMYCVYMTWTGCTIVGCLAVEEQGISFLLVNNFVGIYLGLLVLV
jgi:hypothetical protein